jgi:hypothetical protein
VEEELMPIDIDKVVAPPKPMLEVDEAFWEEMDNTEKQAIRNGIVKRHGMKGKWVRCNLQFEDPQFSSWNISGSLITTVEALMRTGCQIAAVFDFNGVALKE